MNSSNYKAIFKRKSFHLFRNVDSDKIIAEELEGIKAVYDTFEKLCPISVLP
jgi:hypothetical protein